MHAELDDILHQAKNYEEKAKKAMVDAGRLADELRSEQDHTYSQEKAKKSLQSQLSNLEDQFAVAIELKTELGSVQANTSENVKGLQKSDRRNKELQFAIDEDKKNQAQMSELAGKLQAKVKMYKRQIEDAEEIAALNLAKFRLAQQELEEVEERSRAAV